jgi:hypothetical protein
MINYLGFDAETVGGFIKSIYGDKRFSVMSDNKLLFDIHDHRYDVLL